MLAEPKSAAEVGEFTGPDMVLCKNECWYRWCFLFRSARYTEAPDGQKPSREKDGALLAIGALSERLKQQEPYKSALEQMLMEHVLPEFQSTHGHLRAKVGWGF